MKTGSRTRRILIVDDNASIHQDFQKTLRRKEGPSVLEDLERDLFGDERAPAQEIDFQIDSAYQGKEGYERVLKARESGQSYDTAFIDMRMPPGWDGLQTIERIRQVEPALPIVVCTAFSDHTWDEIVARLGSADGIVLLRKPFNPQEIRRLAERSNPKARAS